MGREEVREEEEVRNEKEGVLEEREDMELKGRMMTWNFGNKEILKVATSPQPLSTPGHKSTGRLTVSVK